LSYIRRPKRLFGHFARVTRCDRPAAISLETAT
jgi:hypothetical protein